MYRIVIAKAALEETKTVQLPILECLKDISQDVHTYVERNGNRGVKKIKRQFDAFLPFQVLTTITRNKLSFVFVFPSF